MRPETAPLKVALIDGSASGHHAPYARDIARGLARAGHQPFAVGPPEWCDALHDTAQGLAVAWTPAERPGRFRRHLSQLDLFRRALRTCAEAGIDIAHFVYLDGSIGALVRAVTAGPVSVLATLHWYPFLGASARRPARALKGLLALSGLRGLARRKVGLIVHSPAATESVRGAGSNRVHFVDYPSAVSDTDDRPHERQRGRARLGIPDDVQLLLCFGGTRWDKGVDLAIASLAGTERRIHLLVAGAAQDFDRNALQALAERHGVADRVLLRLEPVPQADVASTFCAADALLLPYRPIFAGQSGPLTIAGTLGVPVIAADVPVLAETVKRFGLGSTFTAGDVGALREVLAREWPRVTPTDRERCAAACDPRRFAARHVEIYERMRPSAQRRVGAERAWR